MLRDALKIALAIIALTTMDALKRRLAWGSALLLWVAGCSCLVSGYSVLTHEQVVDLMWNDQIQPLLLQRFPAPRNRIYRKRMPTPTADVFYRTWATTHSAASSSATWCTTCAAETLSRRCCEDSSDLNEYAFALGALSHYASDNSGHPVINHVVALEFPKLQKNMATA